MTSRGRSRPRRRTLVVLGIVGTFLLVLLGGGIGVARLLGGGGEDLAAFEPELAEVVRGDVTESVTATGTLVTSESVKLDFAGSGAVTELLVTTGDTVEAGQVLARLDDRVAQLEVRAAEATLAGAEAALTGGTAAGSPQAAAAAEQRIAEARVAVSGAEAALAAQGGVADANAASYETAVAEGVALVERDTAVRDREQQLVDHTRSAEPDAAAQAAARAGRGSADSALQQAQRAAVTAQQQVAVATGAGDDAALQRAEAALTAALAERDLQQAEVDRADGVLAAMTEAAAATAQARGALDAADATLQADSGALAQARDAQRLGLAGDAQQLSDARSQVAAARAALRVLQAETSAEAVAPGTAAERAQLQVAVDTAVLDLERARRSLEGYTLTAPIAGTVAGVRAVVGDLVGEGAPVDGESDVASGTGTGQGSGAGGGEALITLTTPELLVAEMAVLEVDAVRLVADQDAELKFASLPDALARGRVLTVEPAEAVEGSPAAYTVRVAVDTPVDGARAGLAVAVRVEVRTSADVLLVPTGALHEEGSETVVYRQSPDGAVETVPVEVGARQGPDAEVVSGLELGDVVEVPPPPMDDMGGEMFYG